MKKFITVFTVLLFAVSIGFAQVYSEYHCICGKSDCSSTEHDCTPIGFLSITANDEMPTIGGNYCLIGNKEISSTWVPADNTVLCLNGHVLKYTGTSGSVIQIQPGYNFTLTDCSDVTYYLTDSNGDGCYETYSTTKPSGDSIEVTGGLITGGKGQLSTILVGGNEESKCGQSGYVINGGGISCQGNFTMYGGNIVGNILSSKSGSSNNGGYGAGVLVYSYNPDEFKAKFTMNGGSITGNATLGTSGGTGNGGGVTIDYYGLFEMNGGRISNNYAQRWGGGISVQGVSQTGSILIHGGEISGNTAKTCNGGGICSNAQIVLDNVTVKDNKAVNGGGICVAVMDTTGSAKFGENTVITGNTATSGLGGAFFFNGNTSLLSVSSNVSITGNKDNNGDEHNVYLQSGKYITVESGFTGTIGVTTQSRPTDNSYIQVTKATNDKDYSSCFIPDYLDDSINSGSGSTQAVKFKPHEHKFNFVTVNTDTLKGYCTDSRCPLSLAKDGAFTSQLITNERVFAVLVNAGADSNVKWTSSDSSKVTISDEGEIIAKTSTGADGVTITATAADGSGESASIKIVVM